MDNWRDEWAEHLNGIAKIFVVVEPDEAGKKLWRSLVSCRASDARLRQTHEGLTWVWGNTSKEISPDGKGRNGDLRALSLLGFEHSDLQDQTLLDHREDHELVHTLYLYRKKANTLSRYSRWITHPTQSYYTLREGHVLRPPFAYTEDF